MESSVTQDPNPGLVDYGTELYTSTLETDTLHSSEISFPHFFPSVPEMETEAVIECKEELGDGETYIREKANQLTCQISPCR